MKKVLSFILLLAIVFTVTGCSEDAVSSQTASKQALPGATQVTNPIKEKSPPHIVTTKYETYDNIVADFDVTEFGADNTGKSDSTSAINLALMNCNNYGGGTVYMPAGKYLITSSINIPDYVTLRGDWQDPDKGNEYGTIIIADVPSSDSVTDGLFVLTGSSGVNGLTVYYKNQSIDNVVPYSFTFYMKPSILASIKNCTIINGYRGIGTTNSGAHEQLTVKNVKGTLLKTGIAINNSSDVGTIDGLTVNSKYWAEAGSGLTPADKSKIEAYTKANGEGMYITDAEQQQMYNISVSGFKYGILFPSIQTRYMGSGSFYNLNITNCEYGIYAQEGTHNGGRDTIIDFRWGYNIANSVIEGSKYSIYNGSVMRENFTACFKLSGVKLSGDYYGNIIGYSYDADHSGYKLDTLKTTKTTGTFFKRMGDTATEDDIQAALDEAGKAGGGIVYLTNGRYTIKKGLTVPENVLLRGKCSSALRMGAKGTVIIADQKGYDNVDKAVSAKALITLEGKNSGVSGIFFYFNGNAEILKKSLDIKYYPYAVRGKAKNVYATNLCIVAATHGIDFLNCENYVVEGIQTTCFENCIRAGGGGIVMNCLQNVTVLVRSNFRFSHADEKFNMFDITRYNTDIVRIENSKNDRVLNCFGYGVKSTIYTKNANDVLCVNLGADNIGETSSMHEFNGGSVTVINSLRYNGNSYINKGCKLKIYNRMGIWLPYEEDVK
ncbi:MAG: hypothetical protein IJ462_02210 [Clostridia bacterium]|nr:hypothetical protein [Clostridia bacterium]